MMAALASAFPSTPSSCDSKGAFSVWDGGQQWFASECCSASEWIWFIAQWANFGQMLISYFLGFEEMSVLPKLRNFSQFLVFLKLTLLVRRCRVILSLCMKLRVFCLFFSERIIFEDLLIHILFSFSSSFYIEPAENHWSPKGWVVSNKLCFFDS